MACRFKSGSGYHIDKMSSLTEKFETGVDIKDLFFALWNQKIKIIVVTGIFSIGSVFYSLNLPNIYKSETVVMSNSSGNSSSISQLASRYSGLASIAGVSLPQSDSVDKVSIGIATLKSYSFFEEFIINNDLFVELLAVKEWDELNNELIIDENIYNKPETKWVSNKQYAVNGKPSNQYAHRKFLTQHFSISKDKLTNFVTISVKHKSPHVAKNIVELLVRDLNEKTRQKDKDEAERSITYLEKEISQTQLADSKIALNNLIQKQLETIMITNTTPEYYFTTISSPIVPELKDSPRRALICIAGFLLGLMLISLYVLIDHYIIKTNKNNS